MANQEKTSHAGVARQIAPSAVSRLVALRQQEISAAKLVGAADTYSDFFVEGGGGSWHEAFTDVITGDKLRQEFSPARMAFVDRVARAADGYSDFFVEGSGPPWHEAFTDVISGDVFQGDNIRFRANALAKLNVMKAFLQMRESVTK